MYDIAELRKQPLLLMQVVIADWAQHDATTPFVLLN